MIDDKKGFEQAKMAREKAYAPYSRFKVGAALYTNDDQCFHGCNVENASYGGSICAERTAVLKAVSEGNQGNFKKLFIVTEPAAVPCGMCLQVLTEFCDPTLEIILCDTKGVDNKKQLKDFLPLPFDPTSLN